MGSAHRAGWFRGEFYMPLPGAAKTIQPGFAQGAADWRSGPRWSILSVLCPVHPFPLRGTSPRWEACHWIRGSRGSPMNPVPLPPPQFGWSIKRKALLWAGLGLTLTNLHILCRMCTVDNKAPQSNPFTQRIAKNKVPPPGGRWWRQPPKGVHFRRPQGGCMVFPRAKARL